MRYAASGENICSRACVAEINGLREGAAYADSAEECRLMQSAG